MYKKTLVVGPAAVDFQNNYVPNAKLKFCMLYEGPDEVVVLAKAEKPFEYHKSAVQFYMGMEGKESAVVCGGGQLDINNEKKVITIFEGSKEFGWPDENVLISVLRSAWPDYQVEFINNDDRLPAEEKMRVFNPEDFQKITDSGVPAVGMLLVINATFLP